ncbi:MAG: hypothetical protein JWQ71_3200 [Pedosphaera sp.]|nr:hypothetical protein [Pedosphaera sp.]
MNYKIIILSLLASTSLANATNFSEDFAADPATHGWQIFGDTSLFHWNTANHNVEVTWDSSKPNSYFHHPLGAALSKSDDFSFAFDLRMADITAGTATNKPYTFQIAVGLINLASASNPTFARGAGINPATGPVNLVEFNYFPDDPVFHFGTTISTTMISNTNQFSDGGFSFPFELTLNDLFHVEMTYTASSRALVTTMTKNGQPFGPISDTTLGTNFTDFSVDQLAVSSYSDNGQDPDFGGSILAHGVMDNFTITYQIPPIKNLTGGLVSNNWQMKFNSLTNWLYTLEKTTDFQTWSNASPTLAGTGPNMVLQDTNALTSKSFYRVHATQP